MAFSAGAVGEGVISAVLKQKKDSGEIAMTLVQYP